MANTNPISILPGTGPITINLPGPYRRNVARRHRRSVHVWQVDRTVRYVRAWLGQPVRATRAQHARVAGLYASVAVVVGIVAGAVVR